MYDFLSKVNDWGIFSFKKWYVVGQGFGPLGGASPYKIMFENNPSPSPPVHAW